MYTEAMKQKKSMERMTNIRALPETRQFVKSSLESQASRELELQPSDGESSHQANSITPEGPDTVEWCSGVAMML